MKRKLSSSKSSQDSTESSPSSINILDYLGEDTSGAVVQSRDGDYPARSLKASEGSYSSLQRTLTANSTNHYSYHSSQEDRQRETPTSQEMQELFAFLDKETPTPSETKKMRKKARRVEDQKARDQALNDGILAQLSYHSSLFSSPEASLDIKTPPQSQTSEGEATLSQLAQEETDLVKYIASWQKRPVSLDERRLYADRLRANLDKQAAIAEKETTMEKEATKFVGRENSSPSF